MKIENPIIAPILPRALGDFVEQSIGACLYKGMNFQDPNDELVCMYVPDAPWKSIWLNRLKDIKYQVGMQHPTPIEFFDMAARPRVDIPIAWAEAGMWDPKAFIVPRDIGRGAVNRMLGSYSLENVHKNHSDDEGKYVVVHWNTTGYEGRPDDPDRSLSEAYTTPLVEYMEREFGVPVVVIGHQSATKRTFDEEIDLIANAWCVVELSPSGPAAISMAYEVPWLRLNCILKQRSGCDEIVRQHYQHCDIKDWWDRSDVREAGGTFTKMSHEEVKSAINEFRVELEHLKRR